MHSKDGIHCLKNGVFLKKETVMLFPVCFLFCTAFLTEYLMLRVHLLVDCSFNACQVVPRQSDTSAFWSPFPGSHYVQPTHPLEILLILSKVSGLDVGRYGRDLQYSFLPPWKGNMNLAME